MRLTSTTTRLTFCAAALFVLRGNGCGETKEGRAPTCAGSSITMVLPPGGCQPLPNVCADASAAQQTVDFDAREYAIRGLWSEPRWATLGTSANRVHLCIAEDAPADSTLILPLSVRHHDFTRIARIIEINLTVSDETWFPEIMTWLDLNAGPEPHDRRVTGRNLGLNVKLSGFVPNPSYEWSVRRRSMDDCSQPIVEPPAGETEAEIVRSRTCDARRNPPLSSGPACADYTLTTGKLGCFEFSVKVTPAGGGMAKTVSTVATVTNSAVANIIFDPAQFGYMKRDAVLDATGSSPLRDVDFEWSIRVDSSANPVLNNWSPVFCDFIDNDKKKCIITEVGWGQYEVKLTVTDQRSGESHQRQVIINAH